MQVRNSLGSSPLCTALPCASRWNHSGWACTASSQLRDRKSTRLNSSHLGISYAVFCLKKKKISLSWTRHMHCGAMGLAVLLDDAGVTFEEEMEGLQDNQVSKHECNPHSTFFFFKESGPPGIPPFSPPHRLPN